jgi:hypothetical protein
MAKVKHNACLYITFSEDIKHVLQVAEMLHAFTHSLKGIKAIIRLLDPLLFEPNKMAVLSLLHDHSPKLILHTFYLPSSEDVHINMD